VLVGGQLGLAAHLRSVSAAPRRPSLRRILLLASQAAMPWASASFSLRKHPGRAQGWELRSGVTTEEREPISELERDTREPRRANEILRAASPLFALELDPRPPRP
jgi:hypothetical protein